MASREVFKAKHRLTGQKVALKKVLMENEKEGVSIDIATLLLFVLYVGDSMQALITMALHHAALLKVKKNIYQNI